MTLDEVDMICTVYFVGGMVVALVSFGIVFISYEHAFNRLLKYFWVVLLGDQDKCPTANFMHTQVIWLTFVPQLPGHNSL